VADNEIQTAVLLDVRDALKNLEKLTAQGAKSAKEIESGFSVVKFAALANLGKLAIDAGKALLGALQAPIAEAIQAEEALTGLNVALKLSGSFSEAASQQFQSFAANLQKTTSFSDEAALGALALAKNLGATNESAKKLVTTAANLSAATGIDLDSATRALSKSLEGQDGQLRRILPQIKGFTEEQLRSGAALDFVAGKFNGAAEAFGNTFQGSLKKTSNAFSDVLETIGGFITQNPIVILAIKTFQKGFEDLTAFIKSNEANIKSFVDNALVFLAKGFEIALIGLEGLIRGFVILAGVQQKIAIAIFSFIIDVLEPFSGAINFVVKAITLAVSSILSIAGALANIPAVGKIFAEAGVDVSKFQDGVDSANDALFQFGSKFDFRKDSRKVVALADDFNTTLRTSVGKAADVVGNLSERVGAFADNAKGKIGEVAKSAESAIANAAVALKTLSAEQIRTEIQRGLNAPLNIVLKSVGIKIEQAKITAGQGEIIGAGIALAKGVLTGAKGAAGLVGAAAGGAADAFLPGSGAAASEIVQILAQGPEQVRAMVTEFVDSIPTIFANIVESIPVIFEVLAQKIPEIIPRLIEEMPRVAVALAAQAPFIAITFTKELIKQIPAIAKAATIEFAAGLIEGAKQFIQKLIDEIKGAFGGIGNALGKVGGFVGGAVKSVGKVFGFADGGQVPGGAPFVDRVPAVLTPGEGVVKRDTMEQLKDFLQNQKFNQNPGSSGSQNLTVILQVGEEQLAKTMLNINRQGLRTS
jgi:hypothetical protein